MGKAVEKYKEWLKEQEAKVRIMQAKSEKKQLKKERKALVEKQRKGYRERVYVALDRAIAKEGE